MFSRSPRDADAGFLMSFPPAYFGRDFFTQHTPLSPSCEHVFRGRCKGRVALHECPSSAAFAAPPSIALSPRTEHPLLDLSGFDAVATGPVYQIGTSFRPGLPPAILKNDVVVIILRVLRQFSSVACRVLHVLVGPFPS